MKISFALLVACFGSCAAMADDAVSELSKHLGGTPALVVAVCGGSEGDLPAIAQFAEQTPWTVLCRGKPSPGLDKIRDWARDNGLLGRRVYVMDGTDASLWLAADMADAVWVAPGVDDPPSEQEILRVLHPGGVCVTARRVTVKPAQEGVDQWRHPYHAPDNNVVSQDHVARLPGELRFQTQPVFAAMPNQTLFAGGRIFFFSGHIAFHEREEPLLNTLTVLNAYNGLRLWSRPLDPKYVVHNVAKLATSSELVFAEGGTLWMLDAATGQERGRFSVPPQAAGAGDTDWKWVAQEKDMLWAAFGPPDARVAPHRGRQRMGHWPWNVADEHYRGLIDNFGAARTLAAFQYPEMKLLWSVSEPEPFDARTLCREGGRIFELAPQRYAAARDSATGKELWRRTPETSKELFETIGNSLKRQGWGLGWATYCCARADRGVVCLAGPPFQKTICVNFANGDLLWALAGESPHPFFVNDSLFVMPRVAGPAANCRAVDPLTGKILGEFKLGVIGSCTRLTVTPNQFFYRPGGGEGRTVYVDLRTRELADYEGVVRPGCFDGVVPANGRLYWMPLACDCWQVHGTFSMAPRAAVPEPTAPPESPAWAAPAAATPAAPDAWPMFRANSAGTATVAAAVPAQVKESWRRQLPGGELTAPVCAGGRIFVGGTDGIVRALDAADGKILWQVSSRGAVLYPPAYWNGRAVFGSCDGVLYCVDASDGRELGCMRLAPEPRFVNIMDRLMSAWPLGGGVIVDQDGIAYTAAGSTAADGAVAAAVDVAAGLFRWRQAYTLDRSEPKLSFGVQSNMLLKDDRLLINGGAPVGIVALDAASGLNPQVVARLEAGREMFLEPDGKPCCSGPELYSGERARTTIFKRHQGRVYFQTAGRHVALVDGRLFCARDVQALDRIVDLMNKDPKTGGKMGGGTVPWDVMQVPVDDSVLWAGKTANVCGLAVGADGLVVLHHDRVEGVSADGQSLWTVPLPVPPVRWGVALTGKHCTVTLSDGHVVCLAKGLEQAETAPVRGTVRVEGTPLPGVLVSDGFRVVRTDAQGGYELPLSAGSGRFVFVSTPAGYWTDRFYLPSEQATAAGRADFSLQRIEQPKRFDFVFITDMHLENKKIGRDKFQASLREIGQLQPRPAFLWSQGDICLQGQAGQEYVAALKLAAMPVRNGPGNHEMILAKPNPREDFEQLFGPTYYSFDWGQIHCIVLDGNKPIPGVKDYKAVHGAVAGSELAWLRADLAAQPPGKPIVVGIHIPIVTTYPERRHESPPDAPYWEVTNRDVLTDLFAAHKVRLVLQGHMHENERTVVKGVEYVASISVSGSWWQSGTGLERGVDGSPRGYRIVSVDGTKVTHRYYSSCESHVDGQGEFHGLDKPVARGTAVPLVFNCYDAPHGATAEARLDDGAWQPMPAFPATNEKVGLAMTHHFRLLADTTASTPGRHRITARVRWPDGQIVEQQAELTVAGQ